MGSKLSLVMSGTVTYKHWRRKLLVSVGWICLASWVIALHFFLLISQRIPIADNCSEEKCESAGCSWKTMESNVYWGKCEPSMTQRLWHVSSILRRSRLPTALGIAIPHLFIVPSMSKCSRKRFLTYPYAISTNPGGATAHMRRLTSSIGIFLRDIRFLNQ